MQKRKSNIKYPLFIILIFCFNTNIFSQVGGSISVSTNSAFGLNMFYTKDKNSFYIGFSNQSNSQKLTVVSVRKKTYGLTPTSSGNYYSLFDFGYGRLLYESIIIQPEISIGNTNYFISYSDKRFKDDGYSLITKSEGIFGFGVNIGYKVNEFVEPFCGFHSIKNMIFVCRIHIRELF